MASYDAAKIHWAVAAFYAAISVAGPALHCVPGSGHLVNVGGKFVYFGLPRSTDALPAAAGAFHVVCSSEKPLPTLNKTQCPICKQSSRESCLTAALDCLSAPPLVAKVAVVGDCEPAPRYDPHFQARAPPEA